MLTESLFMPLPGQPKDTPIPPKLERWNWGAFFLNWIWGLGNSSYIGLLMFVPGLNLVMPFVLGAKGSKWAWKNRLWEDEEHFIRTQRNWARAGLGVFTLLIAFVALLALGLPGIMKNSGAYQDSMTILRADPVATAILGEPVKAGYWIMGEVKLVNTSGFANLSIPVSGPECAGRLISRATRENGVWDIFLLVLTTECTRGPLVLVNDKNIHIPDATPASEEI